MVEYVTPSNHKRLHFELESALHNPGVKHGYRKFNAAFLVVIKKSGGFFCKVHYTRSTRSASQASLFERAVKLYGYPTTDEDVEHILSDANQFADPLLQRMGAQVVDSVDHSLFEGATIMHDMNQPIPEERKLRYSLVFDGGTLEHVFNFPQAIKNCMEMVEIGGHFMSVTPCNNMMGHGFYQFSPETYFRIFCEANGFVVEAMYLNEAWGKGGWLRVTDPDKLKRRVGLVTAEATNLYVRARRIKVVPIFSVIPYQSDYSNIWNNTSGREDDIHRLDFFFNQPSTTRRSLLGRMAKILPEPLRKNLQMYKRYRQLSRDIDTEMFQKIEID